MQQKILKDIITIIKKQKLDDVLEENDGIRKEYCKKILAKDSSFFIKAVNNNLYDYLRDFYILKKKVEDQKELKNEELEIIKKHVIYSNLKNLDKAALERLKLANDALQFKNMTAKIENNNDYRNKIIEFIKQNDWNFYNEYSSTHNLLDEKMQIELVKHYNDYLREISS